MTICRSDSGESKLLRALRLVEARGEVGGRDFAPLMWPDRAWTPQAASLCGVGYLMRLEKRGYLREVRGTEATWWKLTAQGRRALEEGEE